MAKFRHAEHMINPGGDSIRISTSQTSNDAMDIRILHNGKVLPISVPDAHCQTARRLQNTSAVCRR